MEVGAGWEQTSERGTADVNVTLDDPSFAAPVLRGVDAGGRERHAPARVEPHDPHASSNLQRRQILAQFGVRRSPLSLSQCRHGAEHTAQPHRLIPSGARDHDAAAVEMQALRFDIIVAIVCITCLQDDVFQAMRCCIRMQQMGVYGSIFELASVPSVAWIHRRQPGRSRRNSRNGCMLASHWHGHLV